MEVATDLRMSSMRLAPKYWDTTMEQPVDMPMARAMKSMVRGVQVPTEESAPGPTKLPTMMPSTVL